MRLAVAGAAGRMGRLLVRRIHETPGAELAAALERPGSEHLGEDAGALAGIGEIGIAVSSDPLAALLKVDGVIDFTTPDNTTVLCALAAQARIVHVVGTTGMSDSQLAQVTAAARHAAVVQSGNMSLGVNLLLGLVEQAARSLGEDWDVEIVEMHHRMKVDAPSGTALMLGEAAARGRGVRLQERAIRARDGHTGARPPGRIGFASLRGGTAAGDHLIIFAGDGERLEFAHRAEDRSIFAKGAVEAALWARHRKPGLYSMADVLGLSPPVSSGRLEE